MINLFFYIIILWKGDKEMAEVYASLIIKGVRTFTLIPKCIKERV